MIEIEEQLELSNDALLGLWAPGPYLPRTLCHGDARCKSGRFSSSRSAEVARLPETSDEVIEGWDQEEQEEVQGRAFPGPAQGWTTGWPERPGTTCINSDTPSSSPTSTSGRRHQCLVCLKTFSTGDELEIHAIANRHASFVCSTQGCSKAYSRRDACARHVAAHDSKHICATCLTEFARKDHLKRHMRVQHLDVNPRPKRAKPAGAANINIKKVRESEPALRRELSPDSLAIKMLDIAGRSDSAAEGAQKAFACVVACAALNAPGQLTPRTKRRLMTVVTPEADLEPPDLEVLGTLEVG